MNPCDVSTSETEQLSHIRTLPCWPRHLSGPVVQSTQLGQTATTSSLQRQNRPFSRILKWLQSIISYSPWLQQWTNLLLPPMMPLWLPFMIRGEHGENGVCIRYRTESNGLDGHRHVHHTLFPILINPRPSSSPHKPPPLTNFHILNKRCSPLSRCSTLLPVPTNLRLPQWSPLATLSSLHTLIKKWDRLFPRQYNITTPYYQSQAPTDVPTGYIHQSPYTQQMVQPLPLPSYAPAAVNARRPRARIPIITTATLWGSHKSFH